MKRFTALISFFILFFVQFAIADISITPYGGAGTVSGSCFLVESGSAAIVVDCGVFMGDDEGSAAAEIRNTQIDEKLIKADALILTHAHIDHSGRIPLLINKGFKGKIYSTEATKELALAMFKNRNGFDLIEREWFWSESQRLKAQSRHSAAVIHWTDFCKRNIKTVEYSERKMTLAEVEKAEGVNFMLCRNCCENAAEEIEPYFVAAKYGEEIELSNGIKFKLIDAGHIPGSASIVLEIENKNILFSGDLGSGSSRLNDIFEIPEKADMIFMEATYAGESSRFDMSAYEVFHKDLQKAVEKGKTVWIPALAFNRTQKVLYELKLMQEKGKLDKSIPIYSISSSANILTKLYQKEAAKGGGDWFAKEVYAAKSILPKNTKLQMIRSYDKQMILLSSSGDMSMGRSLGLVNILVPRKDVSIMIVNYVSPSSNAGKLLSGKKISKGIKKGAAIKKYNVFSDHPDSSMLEKWLSNQDKNVEIYLVHSQEEDIPKVQELMRKKGWINVNGAAFGKKTLLRK